MVSSPYQDICAQVSEPLLELVLEMVSLKAVMELVLKQVWRVLEMQIGVLIFLEIRILFWSCNKRVKSQFFKNVLFIVVP